MSLRAGGKGVGRSQLALDWSPMGITKEDSQTLLGERTAIRVPHRLGQQNREGRGRIFSLGFPREGSDPDPSLLSYPKVPRRDKAPLGSVLLRLPVPRRLWKNLGTKSSTKSVQDSPIQQAQLWDPSGSCSWLSLGCFWRCFFPEPHHS